MAKTCSITDCESRAVGRGWCHKHWHRWRRWGDPLGVPPPVVFTEERKQNIAAGVKAAWNGGKFSRTHPPGCGHCLAHRGKPKPPRTQAMRDAARQRQRARYGDPRSYRQAHRRVQRERGSASDTICGCGERARQWALKPAPAEVLRRDDQDRVFSVRSEDYEAMCIPCHRRHDAALRRIA